METQLHFFNTLTRKKDPFTPIKKGEVSLYTCGPTVYNFAHIGNFRTYIFEDILKRTIKLAGFKVRHVMNITDVDDKTIKQANIENTTLENYTKKFTECFFEDIDTLGIDKAETYPRATEYIDEMIRLIDILLKKGIAYKGGDGSIFFQIAKFKDYGKLSHLKLDELKAGASERVQLDEYDKENAADFVLWKAYVEERDGPLYWDSPYGKGRPGWHIECSAMAMKLLDESIDIHCGGVDNMFPHHENEIAQSEACTGHTFARVWLHSEHLVVDGKKMSKSLGNFYTLRDLLNKGYTGRQVRYLLMSTHYRTQLNFTLQGLESAESSLSRIDAFVRRLEEVETQENSDISEVLAKAEKEFREHLADDLNISAALAILFDLIREINTQIDQGKIGKDNAHKVLQLLQTYNTVLDVIHFGLDNEEVPADLVEALEKRAIARKEKDWKAADQIRDLIQARGYVIEDGATGAKLKKIELKNG